MQTAAMTLLLSIGRINAGSLLAFARIQPQLSLRFASHKAPISKTPTGAHLRPDLTNLFKKRTVPKASPFTKPVSPLIVQKVPAVPTARKPVPLDPPKSLTTYAYLRDLSQKLEPTTLYRAPNHFWLYVTGWGTCLMCLSWAAFNVHFLATDPPELLSGHIGSAYTIICCTAVGLGIFYVGRVQRIIKEIRVHPLPAIKALGPNATRAQIATAADKAGALPIEFKVRRILPFLGDKSLWSWTNQVSMDGTLAKPEPRYLTEAEKMELKRVEMQAMKEAIEFEKANQLTVAIRWLKGQWQDLVFACKQVFLLRGMVLIMYVEEGGKKRGPLRLDVTNGLALNSGHVLDKLVKVERAEDLRDKSLQIYRR